MNYKLAKQLKEVGFPQHKFEDHNKECLNRVNMDVCFPTLSELIEACGDEFTSLGRGYIRDNPYFEAESYELSCKGKIPLEAVAKLYIKLNKEDE